MEVNKENSCAFFASDYHLEMIMLPYINKKIKENKKIYVFTQNSLEESVNTLIDRVNLDENIKKQLVHINWKNEDENKYKKLIDDNNAVIFIKGNENYINKVNNNLEQIKNNKEMEIIDCYNLEEFSNKIPQIITNHCNIITTKIN